MKSTKKKVLRSIVVFVFCVLNDNRTILENSSIICALIFRSPPLPSSQVLITERSVLTDRFVFAEMLERSGDIDTLEMQVILFG
jgi:hypothetical protein